MILLAGCGTAVTPEPPPPTLTPPPPTATIRPTPLPTATPEPTEEAPLPDTILSDTVTFSSNALAEDTGVLINFQHPRAWQTSYFSDSGSSGWLIANADPNEAFWYALRTGEESLLLIMPAYDSGGLLDLPATPEAVTLEANGKTIQFIMVDGEIKGNIIQDEMAFMFFGTYPPDNEAEFRNVIESILTTFTWEDLGMTDLSDVWLLGTRAEGSIKSGDTVDGYVPMASISEWTFTGTKGSTVSLNINTHEPAVVLILDVLDENDQSLLPDGAQEFTESITIADLAIPADGAYRILVTAPTGFGKFGPWDPPAEAKIYGWYTLTLD